MLKPRPDLAALLDQLLTLEKLDRLPRTGFLQRGVTDAESVAEHSFHVATVAWTLLPYCQPLDDLRTLELALLHDVGEQLIGDLPRPARRLFPEGAKEQAEETAFQEVLHASSERAAILAAELRTSASLEAQYVHHCDRLQLLLKTATYADWNEGASERFFADLLALDHDLTNHSQTDESQGQQQFSIFRELRQSLAEKRSLSKTPSRSDPSRNPSL